jgi:PAS domain S-box-containing protein
MTDVLSELTKSHERYQAFIRNSSEGIWRFEIDKAVSIEFPLEKQIEHVFKYARLAEANDAFAQMYGLPSADELIGAKLTDFMSPSDPENIAYLEAFIKSGYKLSGAESHEITPNGEERYFRNSLIGIIEDGMIARAWGTQQDVTEQRRIMAEMERVQQRLTLALQSSSTGFWEWDVVTGELFWSDELKKLYGLSPKAKITYEKYLSLIHPEDRIRARKLIEKHMKTGEMYEFEHRIIWGNGEIHWILGKGQAHLQDGKLVRMIGTSVNTDSAKKASELADAYSLLKKQRAQLLELNKTKDDFIALASHQLRTPATAVKQYIGLLLEDMAGPLSSAQKQHLQTAFDSNERQLRIINDLLKTAQIDSHRYSLVKQKQNITDIIRASIADLAPLFESRKQIVSFDKTQDVTVNIDADEVRLVIVNLLENASKYSYQGTKIRLKMKTTATHLRLSIQDEGTGIAKEDQKRIFDKFTRVNNDLSDTVTGTGFGLYWVKRIIELHGGTIRVKSMPREGSEFVITLPL